VVGAIPERRGEREKRGLLELAGIGTARVNIKTSKYYWLFVRLIS